MSKDKLGNLINKLIDMISTALNKKRIEEAEILSRMLDRLIIEARQGVGGVGIFSLNIIYSSSYYPLVARSFLKLSYGG